MSTSRCTGVAGPLALALALSPLLAGERERPLEDPGELVLQEAPDDPPAAIVPGDDPDARSVRQTIALGPYISRQVNIDPNQRNITGDAANEPSIAVNPVNPNSIVIGWRQFDSVASNFRQAGWSYTTDGGVSWTFPGTLEQGVFRSDPVLDSDSAGNIYYQSLTSGFSVQVFKSLDGGVSWGPPIPSFGGDKNWMTIDKSGLPSDGHIYGIWQRFAGCCGLSTLTRSTNDGASYETPVQVDLFPTFGTLTVGPDGELYAAGIRGTSGQDFNTFVLARSDDAADPSATPTFDGVVVDMGGSMTISAGPNPAGLLGQATVSVDRSHGPFRGYVYMVASVDPDPGGEEGPTDVHFVRSIDGGQTWSDPLTINDDLALGTWHWFAAHDTAPNSRIDVIWNDTRNSGLVNVSELFYAYSWDAGQTWSPNVQVSRRFDSTIGFPNQDKIGDYYDIVSDETGANVAYAATFNGEQDVYHLRIFPDCNENGISDVLDLGVVSMDCDGNRIPDECEPPADCSMSGALSAGPPGVPLTLDKAGGNELTLSWGMSCLTQDADYEIYEGTIGNFDSHEQFLCSTAGQTTLSVSPAGGDTYYLVVPTNGLAEGSHGVDGAGDERSQGLSPCLPQDVLQCPFGN